MSINQHNYEAFFLDYSEGNLSPEEVAELMLFLEQHPELKAELEAFEPIELVAPTVVFDGKASLQQETGIGLSNYENYFIGAQEGTLTASELTAVDAFLKAHPEKQAEFDTYQQLTLTAPPIVFNHKASLHQKDRKVVPIYYYFVAAAAAMLLFFFLFNYNAETESPKNIVEAEEAVPLELNEKEVPSNTLVEEEQTDRVNGVAIPQEKEDEAPSQHMAVEDEGGAPQYVEQAPQQKPQPLPNDEQPLEKELDQLVEQEQEQPKEMPNEQEEQEDQQRPDEIETIETPEEAVAMNTNNSSEEEYLTLREFANQKIFNKKDKVTTSDAVGKVSDGIAKLTGKESGFYGKKETEDGYVVTEISIGKFGFTRKKRKK